MGDREFYIDLLFYHLKLRAYVVIDLKMRAFKPEFAAKMNFYLSAVTYLRGIPTTSPVSASSFAGGTSTSLFADNRGATA